MKPAAWSSLIAATPIEARPCGEPDYEPPQPPKCPSCLIELDHNPTRDYEVRTTTKTTGYRIYNEDGDEVGWEESEPFEVEYVMPPEWDCPHCEATGLKPDDIFDY